MTRFRQFSTLDFFEAFGVSGERPSVRLFLPSFSSVCSIFLGLALVTTEIQSILEEFFIAPATSFLDAGKAVIDA